MKYQTLLFVLKLYNIKLTPIMGPTTGTRSWSEMKGHEGSCLSGHALQQLDPYMI